MHALERHRFTVAIPVHSTPLRFVLECLESVLAATDHSDEVILHFDGYQTFKAEDLERAASDPRVRIERRASTGRLVDNWNQCLSSGTGALLHIMHSDDRVDADFYAAVAEAFAQEPTAIMVGTASSFHLGAGRMTMLNSSESANLLLSANKPEAGAFVLRRQGIELHELRFSQDFPYCPDEELFLRLALKYGLVWIDRPLYSGRSHAAQERLKTWHRDDFVTTYVAARLRPVLDSDRQLMNYARRETALRLLSVVRRLLLCGEPVRARAVLRESVRLLPEVRWSSKFIAARLLTGVGWDWVWRLRARLMCPSC